MSRSDSDLVRQLRAGDEAAFSALVMRMHPQLVRIARRFVASDAAAEDVAQDTWQAVLSGIDSFEGRSALSSWIVQIAINRAKTRGVRDARVRLPVGAPGGDGELDDAFDDLDQWQRTPSPWEALPETQVANRELARLIAQAMDTLPEQQRLVVMLRDVEGMDAKEVCAIMEISEENQRVLLHRARTKLRAALDKALSDKTAAAVA